MAKQFKGLKGKIHAQEEDASVKVLWEMLNQTLCELRYIASHTINTRILH